MSTFFSIIFFIATPALVVGLIRPSVYSCLLKQNASRKKIALIFGGTLLASFIGLGITALPLEHANDVSIDETNNETGENIQSATTTASDGELSSSPNEPASSGTEEDVNTAAKTIEDSGSSSGDSGATMSTELTENTSSDSASGEEGDAGTDNDSSTSEAETSPSEATDDPVQNPSVTTCTCPSNDLDCGDFVTHAEAQEVYECCVERVGYDVHGLDGSDNDGQVCESLSD